VQTPEHTAFVAQAGDCDDFAVLETAPLRALGHRTRFVTIGFTPSM
jgi:transglutaminase-like putative cysteine protease